ncbi:MAG: hypothetical protein V4642_12180 [Bacteroidota bacterium]
MKSFKNIAVTVLCILLCSCGDDSPSAPSEDRLTPITSVGANTFSCRVNGQIWLPFKEHSLLEDDAYISAMTDLNPNRTVPQSLSITAYRSRPDNKSRNFDETSDIDISIDSIYSIGTFPVSFYNEDGTMKTPGTRRTSIRTSGMGSMDGYRGEGVGLLNITTFDTINRIVSGTFNFSVPKLNGGEIKITDGRFDIKMNQ